MGDDNKSLPDLIKMIRNSATESFIQLSDDIQIFKNKFDNELKQSMTKDEKSELEKVTKMGYKVMPSITILKKNIKKYNEMFMNFRQKEGVMKDVSNDIEKDMPKQKSSKTNRM